MIIRLIGLIVFGLTVVSSSGPSRAAEPEKGATAPEPSTDVAGVEIDGDLLFRVRGTTSHPAARRARDIESRIASAAADPSVPVDSVRLMPRDEAVEIVAGDRSLVTLYEADARLEDLTVNEMAEAHRRRIGEAIGDYRRARSTGALRAAALRAGIATLVFLIGVVVLFRGVRALERWASVHTARRLGSVGIDSFEFVQAGKVQGAIVSGIHLLRALVLVAGVVVYLAFALAQFPWTRALSRHVVALVAHPLSTMGHAIVAQIPNLVFLAILVYVFRTVLRLLRLFFDAVSSGTVTLGGFDREWAAPTYKIVRFAVIAFGVIVAYPYIPGSDTAAFKGVSLFVGVLFSLGSTSALSNLIAGYMMTYRRTFRVGDRVKIGDTIGDVIQSRLQATHVRTLKHEEVILPNSHILNGQVTNYSSLARTEGLILHVDVGIGYETPWRQVEAMLQIAAGRTPGLLKDRKPFILYKGLGDFAVTYELNVYCADAREMNALYAVLSRNILDVFNEYGVQIMTPAYEGDPEQAKVVARSDWFLAPAEAPPAAAGPDQAPPPKSVKPVGGGH